VDFSKGKTSEKKASVNEVPLAPSVPSETPTEQNLPLAINPTTDQPKIFDSELPLPIWFQAEIPTELLRLARANREEREHHQIFADWVERYGGEEGRLLCRFFRRGAVLRHDPSTWQTLSASEARLVAPFSDLVLGIGDRVELPLTETQNITMGWVPPGSSWLGGGYGEEGTTAFTLGQGLWCGIYPVTQEQWQAVMGNNPSYFSGNPKNPVEQVSWDDVQVFLQKLNAVSSRNGFLYRLPSADEWEYILRGGPISKNQSRYDYYFGSSKTDLRSVVSRDLSSTQANFDGNYPAGFGEDGPELETTSAVGNYLPNPLGMYDMHGNVSEWTSTEEGSVRVFYGGCLLSAGEYCAASYRVGRDPDDRGISLGFRLLAVDEVPLAPSVPAETLIQQDFSVAISPIDQPKIIDSELPLPIWFQGEIPTELLRLARAHYEEPVHRQILADWVERYGGEEGRLLCRFFRRDEVLRHDASTWQTLSAFEGRLVAPFSDLVLGIGDRVELPLTETQNITMGWVPPGESWLGGGDDKEGTTAFTLGQGLWCGIYPVTQEQWQAVMGNDPTYFSGNPKNPVEQVPWVDVQVFLQKLNAVSSRYGFLYRLPSADEWEYILRGGPISKNQSRYNYYFASSKTDLTSVASNGLSSTQANFDGDHPAGFGEDGPELETTSAVGNYLPNPLGMYDMHGNVSEWTSTLQRDDPVSCGGSWRASGDMCKASFRFWYRPRPLFLGLGFRLLAVPVGG
jgi:formylglycine-generating enzyme required for sulfatase activity